MSTFTEPQQQAIAARGNVLVSAGAGTGKTRTVVERCLRLILDEGCSLEEILMVTFTEAAAAEMRARLRKELEKVAAAGSALRLPLSALEEQLALLDAARISTLHGFCLQLIREEFHRLELDPQVNVLDDAQAVPLQHETLDALFGRCYSREFPGADGVLEFIRRAGGSEERLRALVLRLHRYTQSRPDGAKWFERQIARLEESEPHEWRAWLREEFIRWRDEWAPDLEALRECPNVARCLAAVARLASPTLDQMGEALREVQAALDDEWKPYLKKEFRDPIKGFFDEAKFLASLTCPGVAPGNPERAGDLIPPNANLPLPVEGRVSSDHAPHSSDAPDSGTRHRTPSNPLQQDWDWVRGPMKALLELARAFTTEFTRAKRAQGGVDFSDLEQLALRLLVDDSGQPTGVARAWQEKFTHVFVDECQDINAVQDAIIRAVSRGGYAEFENAECGTRNVEPLGASSIPSSEFRVPSSGNRFLVGDVKQSIYRFRLAAPNIFRDYERRWRDGGGGTRIALSDNFRSREGVLAFVNAVFGDLMRESLGGIHYDGDATLRFGAPADRGHLGAKDGAAPRVELHVIHKVKPGSEGEPEGNESSSESEAGDAPSGQGAPEDLQAIEKEARLVALRLRALREGGHQIWDEDLQAMRGVEWRDMVVLLRSPRSRVEAFAKEFSAAGVPLAAERAGFYAAIEVQDLLNLLRLLDNPLQDIPLAAVLRSPLVGMSVDELAAVRIAGDDGQRRPFFERVYRVAAGGGGAGRVMTAPREPSEPARAGSGSGAEKGFADLFGDAAAKAREFHQRLLRWRALIRQTSLSHCLETVLKETDCEALLLAGDRGRERAANVRRLLELARQYDPFQRQGLFRFLRFIGQQEDAGLDQDAAPVETENAVRLMSIHRSKGLEFPVVALACLGAKFNFEDLKQDILLDGELGLCPKVAPPHADQRYPSIAWWIAKRREKRELLGEELRLLYVAMTRARDTLVLTGFDTSKEAGSPWGGGEGITERALAGAGSFLGWMRLWLEARALAEDWEAGAEPARGGNGLLSWELVPETAAGTSNVECRMSNGEGAAGDVPVDVEGLRARMAWRYGHGAATDEPAKTSVSALRRRAAAGDEEARPLFRFRTRAPQDGALSAAEVGSAHHAFLQHMDFSRAASVLDLRNEATRLVGAGWLTAEESARLDCEALLRFWQTAAGREVLAAERGFVHRELPFTARFATEELRAMQMCGGGFAGEEFVIVQGVADLAIIRPEGIVLLDFKTDHVFGEELAERARQYRPQLQLYGAALERIYGRPVTGMRLHFLSCGETIEVEPLPKSSGASGGRRV